jgi:hypothetical protein
MRRAHRLPTRLIRWTCLGVCLSLVAGSLMMVPSGGTNNSVVSAQGNQPNGKAKKVKPPLEQAPPPLTLPNLDDLRHQPPMRPEPPPPIFSSVRSKRKPPESRRGRKVGDPGTTGARGIGSTRRGRNNNHSVALK